MDNFTVRNYRPLKEASKPTEQLNKITAIHRTWGAMDTIPFHIHIEI